MTDLAEDVKNSFEQSQDEHADGDKGPIQLIRSSDAEMAPGFSAMRAYYENRLLALTRRGYRHFAGSTMPQDGHELLDRTGTVMIELLTATLLQTFSEGVMIGHREDHLVKMCFHFGQVEHLFHDDDFREAVNAMANGFAEDPQVLEYFTDYLLGGVRHMAHITGFLSSESDQGKVWDIWLLIGTATACAAYLAGHRMGSTWRERDVLDAIEIATEEDPRGPQGEDGSRR